MNDVRTRTGIIYYNIITMHGPVKIKRKNLLLHSIGSFLSIRKAVENWA